MGVKQSLGEACMNMDVPHLAQNGPGVVRLLSLSLSLIIFIFWEK